MNKTKLPNGLMAYGHSKQETRLIYGQVLDYFRNEVKLHPGMTIFDVGSNTGLFALEVLYQTQGNANLYCFEPAPQNFALLERNVKEQFPDSPVKLFPCGLSSTPRTTTFYYRPHSSAMSSLQATASLPDKDRTIALLR